MSLKFILLFRYLPFRCCSQPLRNDAIRKKSTTGIGISCALHLLRGNSFDATFSPLPVGPVSAEAVLVMVIVAQTDAFHVRLALIAMDVFFIVKVTIFVPFYTSIAIHPLSNLV